MIIVMKPDATKENIQKVEDRLQQVGLKAHLSTGEDCTIIGVIGDRKKIANLEVSMLEGVEKTVRITEKYKLVRQTLIITGSPLEYWLRSVEIVGSDLPVPAGTSRTLRNMKASFSSPIPGVQCSQPRRSLPSFAL